MKIKATFITNLHQCLEQMGAPLIKPKLPKIKISTPAGVKVKLSEVQEYAGLLTYQGRQVVVFIPDHSFKTVPVVKRAPKSEGNKFHFSNCSTLQSMRSSGRYEHRYHAHQNIEGEFQIFDKSTSAEVELAPCQNCLKHLNYKGYNQLEGSRKTQVVQKLTLWKLFSTYSTVFDEDKLPQLPNPIPGYTDDWSSISFQYRTKQHFICEECGVDLNDHRDLLHTHHIDGNKQNNREANLQALCMDCHRKQPYHDHLLISDVQMNTLQALRNSQKKLHPRNWDEVYKLTDEALHGVLHYYQLTVVKNYGLPTLNYAIPNTDPKIIVDVAWPDKKVAILVKTSNSHLRSSQNLGWTIRDLNSATERMLS